MVRAGERVAYALCRPPGHHAGPDLYGGFCYLNNAAVAARYLQTQGAKVAILDVDYHHGNGTQEAFYSDPEVLYCSLHADPDDDFPYYWGAVDECGVGAGEGLNHNWPLTADTDDATYLSTLDAALAVISEFRPCYLVVSAGFDIVTSDPVGSFRITGEGLHEIANRIAGLALPTVIVQEGGYALGTLGQNAVAFLQPFAKMS
jgi:acetoin utilization deacetylase AcuC-like enzyme